MENVITIFTFYFQFKYTLNLYNARGTFIFVKIDFYLNQYILITALVLNNKIFS